MLEPVPELEAVGEREDDHADGDGDDGDHDGGEGDAALAKRALGQQPTAADWARGQAAMGPMVLDAGVSVGPGQSAQLRSAMGVGDAEPEPEPERAGAAEDARVSSGDSDSKANAGAAGGGDHGTSENGDTIALGSGNDAVDNQPSVDDDGGIVPAVDGSNDGKPDSNAD